VNMMHVWHVNTQYPFRKNICFVPEHHGHSEISVISWHYD
jgi:hypothetical protein